MRKSGEEGGCGGGWGGGDEERGPITAAPVHSISMRVGLTSSSNRFHLPTICSIRLFSLIHPLRTRFFLKLISPFMQTQAPVLPLDALETPWLAQTPGSWEKCKRHSSKFFQINGNPTSALLFSLLQREQIWVWLKNGLQLMLIISLTSTQLNRSSFLHHSELLKRLMRFFFPFFIISLSYCHQSGGKEKKRTWGSQWRLNCTSISFTFAFGVGCGGWGTSCSASPTACGDELLPGCW